MHVCLCMFVFIYIKWLAIERVLQYCLWHNVLIGERKDGGIWVEWQKMAHNQI